MLLEQASNGAMIIKYDSDNLLDENQEVRDLLSKFIGIFNVIKGKIDDIKQEANYKTGALTELFKYLNCLDTFLYENKNDFDYNGDKRYNDITKKITQIVGENKFLGDQVFCDNFIDSLT